MSAIDDQMAAILEHPLSLYTASDDNSHNLGGQDDHREDRQSRARRQVMKTEYQRTIQKSAERQPCSKSPERQALEN